MMRLCPACLQEKDESEFYNDARRRKCKGCEKAKVPLQIRFNTAPATMDELKEQEGERFWMCNIKRCTRHNEYHPLTAFARRYDTHDGYAGYCRQARKEIRGSQGKRIRSKSIDRRYQSDMTDGEQMIQKFICMNIRKQCHI